MTSVAAWWKRLPPQDYEYLKVTNRVMKTYFVYTSMSGEEHRVDVEEFMKENGYTNIGHCKRNLMMWIGINKHFEDIG